MRPVVRPWISGNGTTNSTSGRYATVFHCPNNQTPVDLSAQLDLSNKLFPPRYPGITFFDYYNKNGQGNDALIEDFSYAARDEFKQNGRIQASIVMPVPVEGELLDTEKGAAIDDIFGNIRPAKAHRGCVEPTSVK